MYIRIRRVRDVAFCEVFFAWESDAFRATSSVARFAKRSKRIGSVLGVDICIVDSKAPEKTTPRTRENLLSDGFWCVESDWIAKGGYSGTSLEDALAKRTSKQLVPYLTTLFGLPVAPPCSIDAFKQILFLVQQKEHVSLQQPIVVYHGTARENVRSIVKGGLKPSYGMFGNALYLGSFWKSYRFATLTQDYKDRPGSVFRVLAFWKRTIFRNYTSGKCFCSACCGKVTYADHQEQWKSCAADAIVMLPMEHEGKFVVRNEEYACRDDSTLFLDAVCNVSRPPGMSHDPWNRSMTVD